METAPSGPTNSAMNSRTTGVVQAGKHRIADGLERLGDELEIRARTFEEAGGMQRHASQLVRRTGAAVDSGADYFRNREPDEMREDLEHAIRERPLVSVGLAAGVGFLLARLLRD